MNVKIEQQDSKLYRMTLFNSFDQTNIYMFKAKQTPKILSLTKKKKNQKARFKQLLEFRKN